MKLARIARVPFLLALAPVLAPVLTPGLDAQQRADLRGQTRAGVGSQPLDFGLGVRDQAPSEPCLRNDERAFLKDVLAFQRTLLGNAGLLPRYEHAPRVLFGWPLRATGSAASAFDVHGISNFVDLDPVSPGSLLDYECGTRSYDLASGYDHSGIDFFSWPFGWLWMDADAVEIVAVADGTILFKSDGNFDESCGFGGGGWNAVYVEHADGSIAWYGHMKDGSLTSKLVGEQVVEGETLGVVGSSGNSTGPHLHLEIYDGDGNLIEPFAGPCNTTTGSSWWRDQRPYWDSGVNRLMVGTDSIVYPACPGRAVTNEGPASRGAINYFTAFYRDQLSIQVSGYRVRRPDGTIFSSWSHASPVAHYAASYWWWSLFLPGSEPAGTWTLEVVYTGKVYTHSFTVI